MKKTLEIVFMFFCVFVAAVGVAMVYTLNKQVQLTSVIASKLTVAPSDVRRDLLSEIVKIRGEITASNEHNMDQREQMQHELKRDRWTFTDQKERSKIVDAKLEELQEKIESLAK